MSPQPHPPRGRGRPLDPDADAGWEDPSPAPPVPLPVLLAVIFAGGFLGGLARYGLVVAFPTGGATFPVTILAVNTAGAFALAVIVVVAAEGLAAGSALRHYLRPGLGTGFCGAFTTFSSVVTAGDLLTAHGHVVIAALYLVASVAAGLAATVLGARVAGRMVG